MAAEVSVPAVSSKWPPLKREPRGPAREWTPDPNKVWTPPPPPKIHVDGYLWPICNLNKPTQLRFLVSHSEAKRLSREHMSNGRDSQFHMFGACAQLSAPDELFPGISARIVMVSGDFNGTSLTVDWLLVFLRSHLRYTDNISLVVPDRFCHVLTGNEGNTLKAEHISRRSRSGSDLLSTERSALSLIDENTSPWKYTDSKSVNQFDKKMKNTRNDQPKVTCTNDFRKIKASEEEAKNQSTECKENRQMYRSAKVALDVRRAEHISRRSRSGSDLLSTERSALSLIDGNTYTGAVLRDPPVVPGLRDNSKRRDLVAW